MQKDIFVVTITRGSKTRYFYGERLKDAFDVSGIKTGDKFKYAKFSRNAVRSAEWVRDGVYVTGG